MGRLDIRQFIWTLNRWRLLHPALAWVVTIGSTLLVVALLLLAGAARHHAALKAQLENSAGELVEAAARGPTDELPVFPLYAERFTFTSKALDGLQIQGNLPGKVSFTYEPNPEVGLVRQTATLTMTTPWQEVGGLLDRIQTAMSTGYISRLQVSRDSDNEPEVGADVQFTMVFRDSVKGSGE